MRCMPTFRRLNQFDVGAGARSLEVGDVTITIHAVTAPVLDFTEAQPRHAPTFLIDGGDEVSEVVQAGIARCEELAEHAASGDRGDDFEAWAELGNDPLGLEVARFAAEHALGKIVGRIALAHPALDTEHGTEFANAGI